VVEGSEVKRAVGRLIAQVTPRTARVKVTGPGGYESTGGWNWERADLKPGRYEVVAGANGYVNQRRKVTLSVDDLQTVKIQLKRPGVLRVVGTPVGARVKIGGPGGFSAEKGLPLTVKGAPAGAYQVKVSRQGYREVERSVSVVPGEATRVEVNLQKEARRHRRVVDSSIEEYADQVFATLQSGRWTDFKKLTALTHSVDYLVDIVIASCSIPPGKPKSAVIKKLREELSELEHKSRKKFEKCLSLMDWSKAFRRKGGTGGKPKKSGKCTGRLRPATDYIFFVFLGTNLIKITLDELVIIDGNWRAGELRCESYGE